MKLPYPIAKAAIARLDAECTAASSALKAMSGGGPMGLTPDSVKFSPEYRAAKARYDAAFTALRAANSAFVKTYRLERERYNDVR